MVVCEGVSHFEVTTRIRGWEADFRGGGGGMRGSDGPAAAGAKNRAT